MTSLLAELLAASRGAPAPAVADARPTRRLAVVTCMDVRIDVGALLGIGPGQAHIIRNAGGRVTDDVLRSLALSSATMEVDTVVLLQHTKCGLEGATEEELRAQTGAAISFLPIADHVAALQEDVDRLAGTPYLSPLHTIAGFLFDVETGRVEDLTRWERPA